MQRTLSRAGAWIRRSLVLAGLLAMPAVARAIPVQEGGSEARTDSSSSISASEPDEEVVAQDSPRTSITQFMELCRAGRYEEAARYLDLRTAREKTQGSRLARRLIAVLDRYVWVDLEILSPLPGGNADDGLPRGTDEIGRVPGPKGLPEPVRIVRRTAGGARWVFSHGTVSRIDSWYMGLEHRWAFEYLPEVLLRPGPRDLLYWQWLTLPLLLLAAWTIGYLVSRVTRWFLARIASRTPGRWDDDTLRRSAAPLTLGWTLAAAYLLMPLLGLYQPAQQFVDQLLRAAFFVVFFWMLARSVDVARQRIADSSWGRQHAGARALLPLACRVGKLLVLAVAVVALLSELGYPVASLVAGLGIGGLAIALAAQKTLENLFGAFSIGADQPFREGDFVRVEDFVGHVEVVGLRSTRFRTLDRTLITIPNGKLADMRLESFAARDRMRLACNIRLVYGTTVDQMRAVLSGFERALREHPKIWPNTVTVRFADFGDSSLNIEVMAWFQTQDGDEFNVIRQEMLLRFMAVVEGAGSAFALPTRTLRLVGDKIP